MFCFPIQFGKHALAGVLGATRFQVMEDGDHLFLIPGITPIYRAKVVIYDLKDVRYTLTQPWDRSVDELAVRFDIFVVWWHER